MEKNLTLQATAVGSLPSENPEEALDLVFDNFKNIPFWPQLPKYKKSEDMIIQYTQNLAGIVVDSSGKIYLDDETEKFFEAIEKLYENFESKNYKPYTLTFPYVSTFDKFIEKIKVIKPPFAKGHITGPFTLSTSLVDKENRCIFFNETLRDVTVKTLALTALWQIEEMKPYCRPIIFIDEPSISQLGSSAFLTVKNEEISSMFEEILEVIKGAGAISAIHCCSKTDWSLICNSDIDIINFDAFSYAQNLSVYSEQIEKFLDRGGFLAFGLIPTLDSVALSSSTVESLVEKFEQAAGYLTSSGLKKDEIIKRTIITPSCGAGSLNKELAKKAMELTSGVSKALKEKYGSENL